MSRVVLSTIVAAGCFSLAPSVVEGASAQEVFASGKTRLAAGDLEGAVKAFGRAVAIDHENDLYLEELVALRKVLALRKRLEGEKDSAQWVRVARALHGYYLRHEMYEEALPLDLRIHGKLQSGLSASLLAQTLMAKGENAEAARTLRSLGEDQQGLGTRAMTVVALARAGQKKEALEVAATVAAPEHLCAGKAFLLARMNAALGNRAKAAGLLEKAFEAAPAGRLPMFKKKAKQCPEFKTIFDDVKYARLLDVKSQGVPADDGHEHDDDHGKGGHCANCPSQDGPGDIPAEERPK